MITAPLPHTLFLLTTGVHVWKIALLPRRGVLEECCKTSRPGSPPGEKYTHADERPLHPVSHGDTPKNGAAHRRCRHRGLGWYPRDQNATSVRGNAYTDHADLEPFRPGLGREPAAVGERV